MFTRSKQQIVAIIVHCSRLVQIVPIVCTLYFMCAHWAAAGVGTLADTLHGINLCTILYKMFMRNILDLIWTQFCKGDKILWTNNFVQDSEHDCANNLILHIFSSCFFFQSCCWHLNRNWDSKVHVSSSSDSWDANLGQKSINFRTTYVYTHIIRLLYKVNVEWDAISLGKPIVHFF